MRIDWSEYLRNHANRRNLLIHLFAVPLFIGAVITFLYFSFSGDFSVAAIAAFCVLVSLVLQGRGHAVEAEAPRPFRGPLDFLRRWFTEQFITFPVFLLSGRWWQQYRIGNNSNRDIP